MSDTPKTDAACQKMEFNPILWARLLETDLAKATEELAEVKRELDEIKKRREETVAMCAYLQQELAEARRCLREALDRVYAYDAHDRAMVGRWRKAAGEEDGR
jgi:septal ring factor EnvC (AmiA/AmiB activator)